jgi:hypothetical protein
MIFRALFNSTHERQPWCMSSCFLVNFATILFLKRSIHARIRHNLLNSENLESKSHLAGRATAKQRVFRSGMASPEGIVFGTFGQNRSSHFKNVGPCQYMSFLTS